MRNLKSFKLFENTQIKEHDMVTLKNVIRIPNGLGTTVIPGGKLGTVVHIYNDGEAFAVEFTVNNKIFVQTLKKDEIEKLKY
jgi:hypothetical protein